MLSRGEAARSDGASPDAEAALDVPAADAWPPAVSVNGVAPQARPAAADVLLHPYFCSSHLDTIIAGGDMPDQDQKLDAGRTPQSAMGSGGARAGGGLDTPPKLVRLLLRA